MIRGIIFDLDDTLYDYSFLEQEATNVIEQYAEQLLQIKKELFREAVQIGKEKVKKQLPFVAAGHSRVLYYQKALEHLNYYPLSMALELEQIYWDYFFQQMKLRKGVEELLNLIKKIGWKISICTDLTTAIQLQKIRVLGLERWIDCIVTSEEVGVEKPNSEIFCFCLEKMQLDRKEVIMVGDSLERDIKGAEKVGIQAIWYVNHKIEVQQKERHMVENFTELFEEVKCGKF